MIENLIIEFYEKNEEVKKLTKEADKLKAKIKEYLREHSITNYEVGNLVLTLSEQDRGKMDEDRLVRVLEEMGFGDAIELKPVPIESEVENLVYNQKLDAGMVQDCYVPNIIQVLSVKKVKGGK